GSGVTATSLRARDRCLGDALADQQHVAEVECEVPARVELTVTLDDDLLAAGLEILELVERLLDLVLAADDADEVVHGLLQLLVQRVGVLRPLDPAIAEGRDGSLSRARDVGVADRRSVAAE